MPWDHSRCLSSCMASSQSVPGSSLCRKESQNSVGVPHAALLTAHVSNTGAACSHPAQRLTKAGGNVPTLRSLLNPCRLGGCCRTPTRPFFKGYLWAPFRNVCSVIYSVFPNLPNEISICPIIQCLFMSYNAHKYCLMLSSRQEARRGFEALIQHYSREIPSDIPWSSSRCTELGGSTAGIKHSPLPGAMLSSDSPWGVPLGSVELHGHLFAKSTLLLVGSRLFHVCFAGCPDSPGLQSLTVSTCTQRHLFSSSSPCWGLIQHLSDLWFTSSPASSSSVLRVIWVLCLRLSWVACRSCLVLVLSHPCWIIFHSSLWE